MGNSGFYCGQYNFWLNIGYGGEPNKTENAAGRMLERERASEKNGG